jgi:hypothetical protein
MSLIGIAGLGGRRREVEVLEGSEALEPEHALKRLRPIADGVMKAAPELPLTEAELSGERLDALARMPKACRGRLHGRVRRAMKRQARRQRREPGHRRLRIESGAKFARRVQSELGH